MEKLIIDLQQLRFTKFKNYYASKLDSNVNKIALSDAGLRPSKLKWIINQDKELKNYTDFNNHNSFKPYFVNKKGDIFDNNSTGDRIKLKFKLPLHPKKEVIVDNKGNRNDNGNIKLNYEKKIINGDVEQKEDIINYAINRLRNND